MWGELRKQNNMNNQSYVKRDPFPMSSSEAHALEASVIKKSDNDINKKNPNDDEEGDDDDTNNKVSWTNMETTTSERGPSDATIELHKNISNNDKNIKESLFPNKQQQKTCDTATTAAVMDDGDDDDDDDNNNDEDEFLDRPIYESRAKGINKLCIQCSRLFERIVHKFYGDTLPMDEFLRVLTLAFTLFFMIGGYWLLRSVKDPVTIALCGVQVIPKCKMLSVFLVLLVVSIYNYLLDTDIPKHKLFYLFGTFYFCLFTFISYMLTHPLYGLPNELPNPNRVLGWISYCSIESFGSVMVALFWSFANSNISLETAKSGYGLMVATAQVGSILGPTFIQYAAPKIGVAYCYFIGALAMLLLQATMYLYIYCYGVQKVTKVAVQQSKDGNIKKKAKPGMLEGLQLLYQHNYVKGILAISCFFMIEVTILDYTMKVLARDYFASEYPCQMYMNCYDSVNGIHGMSQEATEAFTSFSGFFGKSTNMLSFTLSLFGTSAVIRLLGLRFTLLLFPTLCLIVIIFVRFYPTLYVVFGAMMILKANSYALNNPTKEILYQPTNSAVKYKAKSWIDIFGDRVAKALGSVITNAFSDSTASLVGNGSLIGMAVASFLIWNATYMGRKFEEYTESGYVVGEENISHLDDDDGGKHIALTQNDNKDTSCAIVDNETLSKNATADVQDIEEEAEGKDFAKRPDVVSV